jgi:ferredoxin-type protein NapF
MNSTDLKRRAFLKGKRPRVESNPIRPPWSIEAAQFIKNCERCDACINHCPEKIIFRGDGGYPEIDFKRGSCTFCTKCVEVCQHQAFIVSPPYHKTLKPTKAWRLKVAIKPVCLSLNAIVCRACGDNCEEQAIQFRLQLGGVSTPEISADICNGCGECLYVCPKNAVSIQNTI